MKRHWLCQLGLHERVFFNLGPWKLWSCVRPGCDR